MVGAVLVCPFWGVETVPFCLPWELSSSCRMTLRLGLCQLAKKGYSTKVLALL